MLVGALVLVIAVLALRHPKTHVAAVSGSASASASATSSPKPPSSASKSKSKSASKSKTGSTSSHTSSTSSPSSAATGDVKSVPLIVLNNSQISGLAGRAAKRFENGGWTVSDTGNLTNNIVSTCAYYDPDSPGSKAAAEALAQQFPAIQRVKKRFPQLPNGPIVVVLTSGYTSG